MSPDVNKMSPGVNKMSPGVNKMSPDVNKMSPDVNKMSPDVNKMSPDVNKMSPDVNKMSPDVNNMSPDVNKMSPGVNKMSPGVNKMSPDVNKMSPDVNKMSPDVNKMSPDVNKMSPDVNKMSPDVNKIHLRMFFSSSHSSMNISESFPYLDYGYNDTCDPDGGPESPNGTTILHMLYYMLFCLSVLGNTTFFCVLIRYIKLESMTDACLLNLALSDLMSDLYWLHPCPSCGNLFVTFMSVDRYLAIVHAVAAMRARTLRSITIWIIIMAIPGLRFAALEIDPDDNSSVCQPFCPHESQHLWKMLRNFSENTVGLFVGLPVCVLVKHRKQTNLTDICLLNLGLSDLLFVASGSHSTGFFSSIFFMVVMTLDHYMVIMHAIAPEVSHRPDLCYSRILPILVNMRSAKKHRVVKLILSIVIAFFLFWAPYNLSLFLEFLMSKGLLPKECSVTASVRLSITVTESLAYTHCCLNPIIYAFVGQRFMKRALPLLRKRAWGSSAFQPRLLIAHTESCVSNLFSLHIKTKTHFIFERIPPFLITLKIKSLIHKQSFYFSPPAVRTPGLPVNTWFTCEHLMSPDVNNMSPDA
ncbi:hypothetical protein F7725_022172 [Dissostichus mawsoni]|uniref:G-protein coupled receptors family 1 profile domain-containing protein n=1 Tax=Dissostichus mawsoni TaxID=36200 RepID=A0A7J5ZDV9_DISMA|nr:hypothetical protein F7725_022172 [Dissostichus mawsoni]